MTNITCTFSNYLFMVSMIAPLCLSAEVEVGPATPPEVRMKAWEHHVKLRESSIFKEVEWTAVGPRIQGGKIESIWSVKKRKSTLYAGAGAAVEGRLPLFDRPNALDLASLYSGTNRRPLDILEYRGFSQLHMVLPGLHAHFGRRGRTDLHFSREA